MARTAERGGIPFVLLKGLAFEALQLSSHPGTGRPATSTSSSRSASSRGSTAPRGRRLGPLGESRPGAAPRPSHPPPPWNDRGPPPRPRRPAAREPAFARTRLPGRRRPDAADSGLPGGLYGPFPAPSYLAHALVHGLVQHGNAPGSYPLLPGPGRRRRPRAPPRALPRPAPTSGSSTPKTLDAVGGLVRRLGSRRLGSGLPSTLYGAPYSVEGRPDRVGAPGGGDDGSQLRAGAEGGGCLRAHLRPASPVRWHSGDLARPRDLPHAGRQDLRPAAQTRASATSAASSPAPSTSPGASCGRWPPAGSSSHGVASPRGQVYLLHSTRPRRVRR